LHFIVPFPPGGTLDVLARTVSNELGPALGQTIVVENRPGASGVIGAELVARAPADGHTLVIASNTLVTLPALRSDLPFDIFKDFAPVIELGGTPTVITVHPSFPARDLKEASARRRTSPASCLRAPPALRWCMCPIAARSRR
jgi:tripartite-type tricarboxylate transporter receptor subunit TctC